MAFGLIPERHFYLLLLQTKTFPQDFSLYFPCFQSPAEVDQVELPASARFLEREIKINADMERKDTERENAAKFMEFSKFEDLCLSMFICGSNFLTFRKWEKLWPPMNAHKRR